MLNINNTIRVSLLTLAVSFSSFSGSTLYADSSISAQAREEIASLNNDARDGYEVKQGILSVLNHAASIAKPKDVAQIEVLKAQVESMSSQEVLGTFNADFMQNFSQFTNVLNNLQTSKDQMLASANTSGSTLASAGISQLVAGVNLRNAVYTPLCGSTRVDTTATVIALGIFLVAEAIKDAAVSGCGTVVVVAGFGGSPQSAICSAIVSGVFQIARGVWEEFLVCQDSIDSAEILGAYERTEDTFNLVNGHDTQVKSSVSNHDTAIKANLSTHDTAIKANLSTHDTAIKTNLNTHDTEIKANLSTHDTEIKANLNTHDTEIKAELNTHDTTVKNVIAVHDTNLNTKTGAISDGIALHDLEIKTRLDQLDAKLDAALKLLNTIQHRQSRWGR